MAEADPRGVPGVKRRRARLVPGWGTSARPPGHPLVESGLSPGVEWQRYSGALGRKCGPVHPPQRQLQFCLDPNQRLLACFD